MSLAPSPWTRPASMRPGMLSFAGTVSRCPAKTTSGLPVDGAEEERQVVVVDQLERHGAPHDRSASASSFRLSDGTSTSSSVRAARSWATRGILHGPRA